ncbi:uncharacterized protein uimc1 isoform X2 [Halichoeres trimaculatus]|uniref:uncharacterized protein uimc1 isoform X2 n=1 Tax=Halichoeres trimaculatus TaxID=147232 RepID=UPI003D9EC21D
MRGRRGQSSLVLQQQSKMSLRKQIIKDGGDVLSESQQSDENTQVDGDLNDRDDSDEHSTSLLPTLTFREKRKRERENKAKPNKEMTEEEMMDLALRLSEQEASITALRLQKEEEAVMKAIQESMVSQTQPCASLQSQSLISEAEAPLRLCSRRKLSYSNRKQALEGRCPPETDLNGGAEGSEDESLKRSKKRKKREESPLLEMPDLSQTQKITSQGLPSSTEPLDLQMDSPQSCDSTQIEDCKSPVFPSTGCRAEVQGSHLSQNLPDSCRTSGFVLSSQGSSLLPQKSQPYQSKSPTFPKSPPNSRDFTLSKSPMFSETDQGEDSETQLDLEGFKSPVFGRTTQNEKSPNACKPPDFNSAFMSSSQESLSSSSRSTSIRPQSPVFPGSTGVPEPDCPPKGSGVCRSLESSEGVGTQTEEKGVGSTSPVFDREQGPQNHVDIKGNSVKSAEIRGPSQSLEQDNMTYDDPDVRVKKSPKADDLEEELTEICKDCNTADFELSSDMKLRWSEDDEDDVMPAGSPSPVFPKERTDSQTVAMNHVTSASSGLSRSKCRRQISSSEPDSEPASTQGQTAQSHGEPGCQAMVHYYWGVPFCPRGLNPDSYTQVILAQMEVYEKSLKEAQRCLLRKAEWGEGVLPQIEKSPRPESQSPESSHQEVPQRRGLSLRRKPLSKEAEDEEKEEEGEQRAEGEETLENEPNVEEKKNGEGEEGEVDSDGCEICPETQLSNPEDDDDRTQDLLMDTDGGEDQQSKSPEDLDVDMILRDDSPVDEKPQEEGELEIEMEVEALEGKTTKDNTPLSSSDVGDQNVRTEDAEESQKESDAEEVNTRRLQRSKSPEIEPAVPARSSETSVDCPICQGSFPVTEIEMHAAYCDGEVSVVHERRQRADSLQMSSKPRRKRTRRGEVREETEDTGEPFNTGKNQEKCYICQKAFPLRDYSSHIELCIQMHASKTSRKGNLLSALEQTDNRDSEAGPSGARIQTEEVIDLLDDEEEGGDTRRLPKISDSPIRAFTPISEATDCLIDFKKQRRVKKPSQRRR